MLAPSLKKFWFVGHADHRGESAYNLGLGKSRALEVKKHFDRKFASLSSVASDATSEGEGRATITRDVQVLAGDRRVDCFAPFSISKPIVLKPFVIKGTSPYTGELIWDEINPDAPSVLVAGETSTPPKGKGNAVAETIGFLQSKFDQHAINRAIQREFETHKAEAINHLRGHKMGGILAVAHIIARFNPSNVPFGFRGEKPKNLGPTARRLAGISIGSNVHARPADAISVRNAEGRRHGRIETGPNPNNEYSEYRYFWGHWAKN